MVEKLEPEEFEAGENITDQVRRGKHSGMVVSVRLTQEDSAKLIDLAEEVGKTISQVARQAIHSFVSQRRQSLVFAPEITGKTELFDVIAFTPLGPRTANEGGNFEELGELPKAPRTTALAGTR